MSLTPRAQSLLRRSKALALAGLLAYVAFSFARLAGAPGGAFVDNWVYPALIGSSAVFCLARAISVREERLAWSALGAGILSWSAGELYYSIFVQPLANPPIFGVADVLWLGFYPGCLTGLVLLVRARMRSVTRLAVVEAIVAALGITSLAAALVFGVLLKGSAAEVAANLAYFFGDLVLLGVVVAVLALTGWRPGLSWAMLGTGVALSALVDGFFMWQQAAGSGSYAAPVAALWPTSALLIAFAAWKPADEAKVAPAEGLRTIAIATAFAGASMCVLLVHAFVHINVLATNLAKLTIVAAMVRMGMAVAHHTHMLAGSRREALTDSLTGLGNRRKLLSDLERVAAAATEEAPAALILYDLDGFARFNDWHGHGEGDRLLARLGRALAATAGVFARAYRLGGVRFCMLVSGSEDAARAALEAGRSALAQRDSGFEVASSAAIVVLPREASSPSEVLELADERLYAEKARRHTLALVPKTA